jgi:hypothetical protein
MTIRERVRNNKQVIVPIRFTRAVNGAPVIDAPDVDDRGFAMGTRAGSWGNSNCRGAMVGIQEGDTVRVRVLREDIDAGAPLYVTSSDTAVVQVVAPVGGGPLPANGIFSIKGVKDYKSRPVKVEVRLGAAEGPIIGELEPHVFRLRSTLRVLVHFVTINGTPPANNLASVQALLTQVNAIWRPAGIQFQNPPSTRNEVINGFATAGEMTTNLSGAPPSWNEFSTIVNTHPSHTRINIYCVKTANEVNGLTYDNDIARPNGYGIVIPDAASAYDLAHELGHFLDLDRHADENAAGNSIHQDMMSLRRLMYSGWPPAAPAHRNNVGYGGGQYGAMISVKNFPNTVEFWDDEIARSRRRARNPY